MNGCCAAAAAAAAAAPFYFWILSNVVYYTALKLGIAEKLNDFCGIPKKSWEFWVFWASLYTSPSSF